MKNSKIKNLDGQIKKQLNTQVNYKLHFEKTNSKDKIFSQNAI